MLKTSGNTESLIRSGKGGVKVGSDKKAGHNKNELDESGIEGIKVNSGKVGGIKVEKKV